MTSSSMPATGPEVSVIMPALNAAATIGESIRSVLRQTEPRWELLVVDDGSTDETIATVEAHSRQDHRIRLLRTSGRQGPSAARNLAIDAASGRWVAFLDSDDLWAPDKLARQMTFMQSHDALISFTAYRRIDDRGDPIGTPVPVPARVDRAELLKSNCIGCLTAMYERRHFPNARMPELGNLGAHRVWSRLVGEGRVGHEDFAFWLDLLAACPNGAHKAPVVAHGISEPLAFYRVRSHSLSSNKLRAAVFQWLIYRTHCRLPRLRSLYLFAHYAWRGVVKHAGRV